MRSQHKPRIALGTLVKTPSSFDAWNDIKDEFANDLYMVVGTWSWVTFFQRDAPTRTRSVGDDPRSSTSSDGYLLMRCGDAQYVMVPYGNTILPIK